ncbi:DnaA regulatory inactivator Hda [Salinisphaera sp. USBA-960]|uniref:DnaA regulatory inactivator Hda n=1 Tax=Salinisphaera orenii TaxID=856731 RepID=UPI000DBE5997|nr:DnaA regulatory inactivator Hda [Salifodinibacter halophilus]NNC25453.1 DnaA regulatory inactivator Hda [Salifodinibacter halophilus]
MTIRQLPLDIELPQSATLAGFVGPTNFSVRAAVAELVDVRGQRLFLHGPEASGKSHLLQAACRAVSANGGRAVYLPLTQFGRDAADVVSGLGEMDLVCVDDIATVGGQRDTEIAFVGLADMLQARGGRLLTADREPPASLNLALADLASRLAAGGIQATASLNDTDKQALLIARAAQRGITLSSATADWLLNHGPRDISSLIGALDRLGEASLSAKRRITIPFAKRVLAEMP